MLTVWHGRGVENVFFIAWTSLFQVLRPWSWEQSEKHNMFSIQLAHTKIQSVCLHDKYFLGCLKHFKSRKWSILANVRRFTDEPAWCKQSYINPCVQTCHVLLPDYLILLRLEKSLRIFKILNKIIFLSLLSACFFFTRAFSVVVKWPCGNVSFISIDICKDQ